MNRLKKCNFSAQLTDNFKQPPKQDGAKQHSAFEHTLALANRELDLPDALLDLGR